MGPYHLNVARDGRFATEHIHSNKEVAIHCKYDKYGNNEDAKTIPFSRWNIYLCISVPSPGVANKSKKNAVIIIVYKQSSAFTNKHFIFRFEHKDYLDFILYFN